MSRSFHNSFTGNALKKTYGLMTTSESSTANLQEAAIIFQCMDTGL